ncbi:hypothetical protein J6590_047853 [Homalodisca vitripennis]|nr:hypothetical protein J6590_047853 [Homalodisca vitripennis]
MMMNILLTGLTLFVCLTSSTPTGISHAQPGELLDVTAVTKPLVQGLTSLGMAVKDQLAMLAPTTVSRTVTVSTYEDSRLSVIGDSGSIRHKWSFTISEMISEHVYRVERTILSVIGDSRSIRHKWSFTISEVISEHVYRVERTILSVIGDSRSIRHKWSFTISEMISEHVYRMEWTILSVIGDYAYSSPNI